MVAERIRWETMDKVERKAAGMEGGMAGLGDEGVVTALISSRCRRGPGRKQKAIRHQTFKLENFPAGPSVGRITPVSVHQKPPALPSRFPRPLDEPVVPLYPCSAAKPHTIPAVDTVA